jgi:CBS domain-containing protein
LGFFAQHAPFNRMERAHLLWMLERMQLGYYAQGEVVASPQQGEAQRFYVIKQGVVRGAQLANAQQDEVLELHEGECFPVGALLGRRAVTSEYRAQTDVFCFELGAEYFHELIELSVVFKDFCTRRIAALFEQSTRALQAQLSQTSTEQQSLSSPLESIMRRSPISCGPEASIRSALQIMRDAHVGSMIVTDGEQRPVGIFTLQDLLERVVLADLSVDQPIGNVMSRQPVSLPPGALAYEAAMVMASKGFRHVLATSPDGKLHGIVSERDLFSLQRVGLRQLSAAIRQADSVEALVALSGDIHRLAHNMMAQGVAAEQLTQMLSTLNDLLAKQLIELECAAAGLNTDQDNALVFVPPPGMTAAGARERLLPVALRVNRGMARCGFPLCKGNIMASNPQWCLSLEEWQAVFARWVDQGSPKDLMHASIFFDFRALAGQHGIAETLRGWLAQLARGNVRFLHQMAANSLRNRPPLGLVRDFVLDGSRRLDLKLNGLTPFVDAARIFSLATGVTHTNTIQRLRLSAASLRIPADEVEAWVNALLFIQMLRLRHHFEAGVPALDSDERTLDNLVDPAQLNELDRRILKEAFRQARKVQARLALDYQL